MSEGSPGRGRLGWRRLRAWLSVPVLAGQPRVAGVGLVRAQDVADGGATV